MDLFFPILHKFYSNQQSSSFYRIEHLHPDVLEKFPETVFGHMKPKIVIITTPNREYNVLFENFEGPFRHWDHKFEWTRSEFQNWVQTCIIDKYPDYIVERFDGLGKDLFRNGWNT